MIRDIKGANILVDPNGRVKLADFGMAKHVRTFSELLNCFHMGHGLRDWLCNQF